MQRTTRALIITAAGLGATALAGFLAGRSVADPPAPLDLIESGKAQAVHDYLHASRNICASVNGNVSLLRAALDMPLTDPQREQRLGKRHDELRALADRQKGLLKDLSEVHHV
jgi:hypothetical protein